MVSGATLHSQEPYSLEPVGGQVRIHGAGDDFIRVADREAGQVGAVEVGPQGAGGKVVGAAKGVGHLVQVQEHGAVLAVLQHQAGLPVIVHGLGRGRCSKQAFSWVMSSLLFGFVLIIVPGDVNEVFRLDDDFRHDLTDGQAGLKTEPPDHFLRLRGEPDGADALIGACPGPQNNGFHGVPPLIL